MREHREHLAAFSGMPELIKQLAADGNSLFIVSSNSARNVRHFLRRHELEGCFVRVVGSAGFLGKARIVRNLQRRYRWASENCWMVGDEVTDMLAAKQAHCHGVAVTWGFADPADLKNLAEYVVTSPSELVSVLTD
jgi:HAD superfamily hydrolase (TIGR01549 family)